MPIVLYIILVVFIPSLRWHWGWFMLSVLVTIWSGKKKKTPIEKNGEIACEYTIDESADEAE